MKYNKDAIVTMATVLVGFLLATGLLVFSKDYDKQTLDARSGLVGIVREAVQKIDRDEADGIFVAYRSELPGYIEGRSGARIYYVSDDGRYVIRGDVFDVRGRKSLSENSLSRARAIEIAGVAQDFITFKAPEERASITVFTDPDCPFCRKLQEQVKGLNDAGITVNYLPFPLSIHPEADRKSNAIWCAEDRKAAFIAAFEGIDPGSASCKSAVDAGKTLGESIGVAGTPTIYAADGSFVPHSLGSNPKAMLALLEQQKSN